MFASSNFQPHLVLIVHTLLLLPSTLLVFNMGGALPFKAHCHCPLLSPVPPHSCLMHLGLFVILLVAHLSLLVHPHSCLTCLRLFVILPVTHPSSLVFNVFEAHCCCPPLLPTVVAHCHHPPLLPTVQHHCSPWPMCLGCDTGPIVMCCRIPTRYITFSESHLHDSCILTLFNSPWVC